MDRGGRHTGGGCVQRHEPNTVGSEEYGLGEEVPDAWDPRDATYDEQIIAAYERGRQAAMQEQPTPTAPQVNEAEEFRRLVDFFYHLGPPKFDGTGGYVAAEEWLANIKEKLRISRAPKADQVELATHFLESSARFWWEVTKQGYHGDLLRITWEWFEQQFTRRYLSTLQKEALRRQFMTLRQYDQSVAKYNYLFIKLSRYVPDIRKDPYRYCRHYLDGLQPEIAMVVDNPRVQKVQVLMNHAKRVEAYLKRKVQQ